MAAAVDISDLPVPPSGVDISDLPVPPTASAPSFTRPYTPAEAATYAEHPELAPGAKPSASWSDIVQSLASGVNAGAVDLAGLPMDTANNTTNLAKAAVGYPYSKITGNPVPSALEATDAATVPGTSEWAKAVIRRNGGANLVDVTGNPNNPDLAAFHAGAEIGGPGAVLSGAEIARAALAEGAAAPMSTAAAKSAAAIEGAPKPVPTPKIDPATVQYDASGTAITPTSSTPQSQVPSGVSEAKPFQEAPADAAPDASPSAAPSAALPLDQQAQRVATLKAIGLNEARDSAVTGDVKGAASDYQTSKLDNTAGNYVSAALDNERSAMTNYADKIVSDTGGTAGTDQNALLSRGSAIVAPLDDLKGHFDDAIQSLYAQADRRAQGTPISLPRLQSAVTGDTAGFLGTTEGEALLRGVQARMRSLGMTDAEGNAAPVTVQQAEQFKQYLNNQWQPRTARLIRVLKDATDDDVTSAAGVDIYAAARGMRAQRAATLDNPNGIAKLMDSSGPDNINRAVPTEQIPDTLARMPVAQFSHVVNTLRNAPAELQPQATEALNEIRAHLASRVQEAGTKLQGMWNNKGVTQYLNQNAARLAQVFTPVEMRRFATLNDAGNILRIDRSYPGAAAQTHNLAQRGVLKLAEHAETIGALAGHIPGAVAGAVAKKVATGYVDKAALAAVKKRFRQL